MDIIGLLVGVFSASIFWILTIALIVLINLMHKSRYNKLIKITNRTGGKETIEWVRAKLMKHKVLGDVYHAPALRKEDRQYIPYTGKVNEYATNKNKVSYVALSFYNGTYSPEEYVDTEEQIVDVIEKRYGTLTEEEFNALPDEEKKDKKYKPNFIKVRKKQKNYIIKPTKYSMRQFNLDMDTAIKDDFMLNPGWFERHGAMVISVTIVFLAVVLSIIMVLFTYQWGVDVVGTPPAWLDAVMQGLSNTSITEAPVFE